MAMIQIEVEKTLQGKKHEGEFKIHANLTLNQEANVLALKGESGSGKTSLLRMIAGLMEPDKGFIKVNGQTWYSSIDKVNISVQNRKTGFVFQDFALFPHMTVRENLIFSAPTTVREEDLMSHLEMTGLETLSDRHPASLSAGQKQRAAIARALIMKPSILLLDEPLSALDEETRLKMQSNMKEIFDKLQIPVILVSHNMSDVKSLADQVALISNGMVMKEGD